MHYVIIKSTITTIVALLFRSASSCQPQTVKESIIGVWNLADARKIFPVDPTYYDQVIEVVKQNEISFSKDCVIIQSGIYYLTKEEWPQGHYPWIYCGAHTSYKIKGDKLSIYNPGYKTWKEFSVKIIGKDSMILSSDTSSFSLYKKKIVRFDNGIVSIHLKVVHVDPFLINYDVYVEKDRIKVSTGKNERKVISQRYVDYIFDNFRRVNVSQLQDLYSTEESGNRILELDIEYDNGKRKHSRIIGEEHPDELKLALLPIIYAGDFINHKEYWSGIVK